MHMAWAGRLQACRGPEGVALPLHVAGAAPLPRFHRPCSWEAGCWCGREEREWHVFHLNPSCLSASPDSRHGFSLKPHLPPTVGVSRLPLILSAFLRDQAKVKLRTRAPLKHLSSFRPHLAGSLGGGRDATLVVHLFPNPHADIQSRGRHLWISSSFIARAVAFLIPRRLCFL